ncbi:hypothetical protein QTO02_27480 [Vibrio fortis]
MRKIYVTEGDINAKKQKDAYPKRVLCEQCVSSFIVISEGDRTYQACDSCDDDS